MTVKIYCDICGELIPEQHEGEGEDAGQLVLGWGPWGERLTGSGKDFDFDALCDNCHEAIKEAIEKLVLERGKKKDALPS